MTLGVKAEQYEMRQSPVIHTQSECHLFSLQGLRRVAAGAAPAHPARRSSVLSVSAAARCRTPERHGDPTSSTLRVAARSAPRAAHHSPRRSPVTESMSGVTFPATWPNLCGKEKRP